MNLWNLDRIDQWNTVGSNQYQHCERARDVMAYIPDTGVMGNHQEFLNPFGSTRVYAGACFADDCGTGNVVCGGTTPDLISSHGTAVASILGGRTVGVAKEVKIVPIRIASCGQGFTTERLNQALDWIRSWQNVYRDHRPALVSMSVYVVPLDPLTAAHEYLIGRLVNNEWDLWTGQLIWRGIPVIVSAGNSNSSTCRPSPARLAHRNAASVAQNGTSGARVISVGGTSRATQYFDDVTGAYVNDGVYRDVRWICPVRGGFDTETCLRDEACGGRPYYGSNFGNIVDIYAPAHQVESAYTTATNSYRQNTGVFPPHTNEQYYGTRSGTSFAAPLAAGVAARILQVEPNLSPDEVWNRMKAKAQQVGVPFDRAGWNQYGIRTENNLLLNWRYSSPQCTVEYP